VTGGLTATQASRVEANLPTPWAGVSERISIGGYLLWQVVLAVLAGVREAVLESHVGKSTPAVLRRRAPPVDRAGTCRGEGLRPQARTQCAKSTTAGWRRRASSRSASLA
jgi:hypothetical protein